jgi:hypothetical protein
MSDGHPDPLERVGKEAAATIRRALDPEEVIQVVIPCQFNEVLALTGRRMLHVDRHGYLATWPIAAVTRLALSDGRVELDIHRWWAANDREKMKTLSMAAPQGLTVESAVAIAQGLLAKASSDAITGAGPKIDRGLDVIREPSQDGRSIDGRVAIVCVECGAGVLDAPTSTSYACSGCGGRYLLSRCPHCHAETHIAASATGKAGGCSTCRRSARWEKWAGSTTNFAAIASNLGIPKDEAADPDRRVIWGVAIAVTGFPSVAPGLGCSLTFTRDAVALRALERDGRSREVALIPMRDVRLLRVAGRGAIRSSSGGGWMGGGFGVQGMIEGVLLSGALNALTSRTIATIETFVHFGAGSRELLMLHSTVTPEVLEVRLAPAIARIQAAQAANESQELPGGKQTPQSLAQDLQSLASLRDRGVLTDEEFEKAERAALRDHEVAS